MVWRDLHVLFAANTITARKDTDDQVRLQSQSSQVSTFAKMKSVTTGSA
jgi:hypothetical protein